MAETYTRSFLGAGATHHLGVKTLTLPDSAVEVGRQKNLASTGAYVLCQGPDGQLANHVFDAERSTPTNPILRRV